VDLDLPALAGLLLLGYLLGSVASAIVVCRLLGRPDPRSEGSRNPGATNVLRVAGRAAAALTLAGDLLKGLVAVLVARALTPDPTAWALTGSAAFLGHLYPLYFGFRGGKGVATALGALLAATPWAGLLTVGTWLLVVAIVRISALAALTAFALAPIFVAATTRSAALVAIAVAVSILLFWRHRSNIRQLLAGTGT
jgi:glycerol-3-phosphate acyltransferase PlsY